MLLHLLETRTAVPNTGIQKLRTDSRVRTSSQSNRIDICPCRIAQASANSFAKEIFGRQQRICSILRNLSRAIVHKIDWMTRFNK